MASRTQTTFIKSHGSLESAPLMGLSAYTADPTDSGAISRANCLVEAEEIATTSAPLVIDVSALRVKNGKPNFFIDRIGNETKREHRHS